MTGLLLLAPLLMAFLPGLWSFGHMKRMFWTMMVFLFLPVLLMIPGGMLLEVFGMTWRCAAVRCCGLLFFAGIAVCFLWAAAYLWREVPVDRWHGLAVWLCRLFILVVVGSACIGVTLLGSFLVWFLSEDDYTVERDGQIVVEEYLWYEGSNYYACCGPFLRGTELLEGSAGLEEKEGGRR